MIPRVLSIVLAVLVIGIVSLETWTAFHDPDHVHPIRQAIYNVAYNPLIDLCGTILFGIMMFYLGKRE